MSLSVSDHRVTLFISVYTLVLYSQEGVAVLGGLSNTLTRYLRCYAETFEPLLSN